MVTNYDMEREIKYLNVITVGQFKTLNEKESKKIALDSLIKDNIKVNEMANHDYIMINDEMIDVQIFSKLFKILDFGSIEGF